ncbi:MAG: helix-turn-helix transcriptional regulator [Burkholderiales bacterium]|nr:helix-turn-helix transcriptional regulator [Burkholderiales bacterium]
MTSALKLYQGAFGRAALLDSDTDLATHAHPQCHVMIKAGGADTEYRVGERAVQLSDDRMVLINAWGPHSKVHQPLLGRSVVLVLCVEPQWLAAHDSALGAAGLPGFFPEPCVDLPATVRTLADRLIGEMLAAESAAGVGAALGDLMLELTHHFAVRRSLIEMHRLRMKAGFDARIARATRYIASHLHAAITCEELARLHNMSRQHFFARFRDCTGVSPILYLNTLRMESAFAKLGHDGASINDVAGELGFSEPHHFTRFFRRNLGIPPSQYRRSVVLAA